MPVLTSAKPFLRHIEALNVHDAQLYRPFYMEGVLVGLIRKTNCEALATYPDMVRIDDAVTFLPTRERSAALESVVNDLATKGHFKLRGEAYPVTAGWGEALLATIDRGAAAFFGTPGFGVHVNGLVQRADGLYMWVARRSADRAVAPGKLDQIIGGGLGAGYTAHETLIKEANEEAGLAPEIAAQAVPVGIISYICDTEEGIKRDTIFAHDLYLPENVVPENRDGEVERFELMPIEIVAALVMETNDFKANVNLVIADLLLRHGYLKPDMPGYIELARGLRK